MLMSDDPEPLRLTADQSPSVADAGPTVVVPSSAAGPDLVILEPDRVPTSLGGVDVVFPLLHGAFGEDGTIQGLLELADTRYVGSGVAASAVMMDKHLMKLVFEAVGLPVGPYAVITDRQWLTDRSEVLDRVSGLGWPLFVKPARAGSSMGVSKASDRAGLERAIDSARAHDPKVVVEAAIAGRELECGVLQGHGNEPPRTSVLGECRVVSGHEFYDFDAKYLHAEDVVLQAPAQVPQDVSDTIRALAAQAFDAAGCEGLARCDFFYTDDGQILINEVNTMPGFTPTSMFPRMWAATGISYAALIDELIELALQRRLGLR